VLFRLFGIGLLQGLLDWQYWLLHIKFSSCLLGRIYLVHDLGFSSLDLGYCSICRVDSLYISTFPFSSGAMDEHNDLGKCAHCGVLNLLKVLRSLVMQMDALKDAILHLNHSINSQFDTRLGMQNPRTKDGEISYKL
jgi:hypothetical protein